MSSKPETYVNVLYNGTGFYAPEHLRRLDRVNVLLKLIIPSFRRNEKAYSESVRSSSITEINENGGRIVQRLDLAAGETRNILLPGQEIEDGEERRFSNADVFITGTERRDEAGEVQKGAQYAIYIHNTNLDSQHLFFAETEHEPEPSEEYFNATQRFVGAFAVDVASGRHFSPEEYSRGDGARLIETVGHTLNKVDFQLMMAGRQKSPLPTELI